MSGNANKSKLSTTVVPRHYVIELKPDFDTLKYEGKSVIDIEIKKPITYVTVHLVELEIRAATITEGDDEYFWESNLITYEEEAGTCTIFFPKIMKEGFARLSLEFSGYLDDTLKGFYRCKYLNNDGVEKFGAATQFQATHARRCFPCWDEPNIKASFEMVITVPHGYTALSNMTVKTGQDLGDFRRVEFDKSPPMSSYLVAAVVGYYDFVEGLCNDFVRVRVYTPVGKREQGLFALEVATKVLPFYREYFDVDYPLPKLDLVTIPSMAFEGMENWGLVTFRESSILIDSDNSSAVSKQWIALLIAHEVAHQWFGNLVTMEWWSDLWLNEGYASFIEFLCIHHIFPEFGVWTQFVTDTLTPALELDGLKSSHPVQVPVGLPYEVDEIFDDISFSKGASLIRMLHYFVGDDYFRVGMNEYLTRHYYGNTRTQDLWDALEDASGRPVGGIMSTWTLQKGFPIIVVTQTHVDSTRILKMTQKKFCAGGPGETPVTVWKVPISVSTSRNPRQVALNAILDERAMKVTLSVSATDWVKINAGSVGYYRVMYPPEMLTLFEPAIKNRTLPSLDRIGVVDDLFALVRAGYTSSVHFLRLLEAFSGETNYTVWTCITNCISTMITLMSDTAYRSEFNAFGRHLYASVAKRLGWRQKKGESHLDTLLRRQVLNVLVAFEDHGVIKEAVKRYYKFIRGSDALSPDLRNACYRAAMWKSDDPHATLSQLMNLYRKSTVNEEKVRILHCLGSFRNEDMLSEVLAFSVSDEVRLEDTVTILESVAKNPVGRELAWKFFQENCYIFWTKYNGNRLLCQLVKAVTEKFVSETKAKEIEDFFILHPFSATKRTIQQSLEKIRYSALWLDRDIQDIGEFLTGKKVVLKKRESVELDVAIIDGKVVQNITGALEQDINVASQEAKAIHETDDEVGDVLREAQPVTFGETSSEKSTDFKNVLDIKSGSGMGKNRMSDVSNDQDLLQDLSMKQSENVDVELTETVLAYTTTEFNSALANKYIGNSAISKKSLDGQIFAPITTRPSDFVTQDHDRQKQPNNKPWDFDLLSKYLLSTENTESIHNEGKSEAGKAETEFTVFEELVAQLSHMSHRAERLSNLEVPSDASASFATKKIIDLSIQMDAIISSTDHTDTSSHDITDESIHADSKTNTTKTDDTEFTNSTKTDDTDFTNTTSECTERNDTKSEFTDVTDNSDVSEALDSEEILIDSELRPHLQEPTDEYLTRASTDIITNYVGIILNSNADTEDVVNKSQEEIQLLKQVRDISTDKIAQDVIPVSRKSFHNERDRFFKTAINSSEVAFIVNPSRNKRASNVVTDVCFNYKSAEVESSMDTRKSSDTDEYESDSEADNGTRTSFPYGSIEKLSVIKQDILNNSHNTTSPSEIKSVAAKLSEIITTDYTETDSEMCEDGNSTRTTLSDQVPEPVMDVIKPPKESLKKNQSINQSRSFVKSDKRSSRTTRDCKLSNKASGNPASEKVVKPCLKRINIKEVAAKMSEILTTDGSDNDQEPTDAVVIPAVSSDVEYNEPLKSSVTLAAVSPVRVSKKKRISLIKSLDMKNTSEMETAVTDFESSKFNFSRTSTVSQAISKNGSHISKAATDTDSNSN